MNTTTLQALRQSLAAVAAAALLMGCGGDASVAPEGAADLGSCDNLRAPATTTLTSHVYATGVQIYRWNDTTWVFISPSAVLTADAAGVKKQPAGGSLGSDHPAGCGPSIVKGSYWTSRATRPATPKGSRPSSRASMWSAELPKPRI